MNKQALMNELAAMGMRPGRGLGQNFLIDNNLLDAIVRSAAPSPGEKILEVGPGFGALTGRLIKSGAGITAVEYDHRLAARLKERYDGVENFRLIEADACRVDYNSLFPDNTPYRVVANLPYAISSIFIARIAESANPPQSMLLMLQLEMGERLAAPHGCHAYGALTVRIQSRYQVSIVRKIPPEVFYPAPEVESALVKLVRRPAGELDASPEELKKVSSLAGLLFSQRRKQMGKVLSGSYGRERTLAALEKLGFPPELRPERLTPADFLAIARELSE